MSAIIIGVQDLKDRITEVAELMDEYQLAQAELSGEDWRVAFRRRSARIVTQEVASSEIMEEISAESAEEESSEPVDDTPDGEPLKSPMNGIYYASSSPTAAAFVKEGEEVTEGQVVGLIEAMKVFNEIVAPYAGTVTKILAENGKLVQPEDVLMYITKDE